MLREVVADVWVIESAFEKVGIDFGARMTIVRRKNGELFAYAPFAISDEEAMAIRSLGEVRDIVAPNAAHFMEIREFTSRFPDATLWTLPEIDKRVDGLRYQHLESLPERWKEDFEGLLVDGLYGFREWVFLHRASRSLIVTDLGFHLPKPQKPLARIAFRLNGVTRRFGTTRFVRHLIRLGKKDKVRENIRIILGWDFERIIAGHGFIEESRAKQKLRTAYSFLDV
ncbi:DUF4336 domain-containing protein [bacterium]|nr:MAG: DUF4336 domain-containing protein [bacterium]